MVSLWQISVVLPLSFTVQRALPWPPNKLSGPSNGSTSTAACTDTKLFEGPIYLLYTLDETQGAG